MHARSLPGRSARRFIEGLILAQPSGMETRDLYRQKFEAQIHEWTAKLEALGAHVDKLTAEAKLGAKPHVDTVRSKLEMAKAKAKEIASTTDDAWDAARKGADRTWTDVKAAIEGAYDAVMTEGRNKK